MSVVEMRKSIEKVYPGDKWKNRVKNMKDSQVLAIYYKMITTRQIK